MKIKKSLLNVRHGELTATREFSLDLYEVTCSCGVVKIMKRNNFHNAYSCGHLRKLRFPGWSPERIALWKLWDSIIGRCTKWNHKLYPQYGRRGIKVCVEWQTFEKFEEDMRELWKPGGRLRLLNPKEGYTLHNVRFLLKAVGTEPKSEVENE